MVSLTGRGFDSRQLHDQTSAATSERKWFLFYCEALRACPQKRNSKINEPFAVGKWQRLFAGLEPRDHRVIPTESRENEAPPQYFMKKDGERG